MRPYLQAVYNNVPDPQLLELIRSLGYRGIRADMQLAPPDIVEGAIRVIQDSGLECLYIVRLEQMPDFPAGSQVELRNEPDIEGPDAEAYGLEMQMAYNHSVNHDLRLWVGAVSGPHERGRAYLEIIQPYLNDIPKTVGLTIHRYLDGNVDEEFSRPHKGFQSREAEVDYIREIAGPGRRWGISEFGSHTAPRTSGWWIFKREARWTDEQVGALAVREWDFWEINGASFVVQYQITDGPSNHRLDRYGIMRLDGTIKPSGYSLK